MTKPHRWGEELYGSIWDSLGGTRKFLPVTLLRDSLEKLLCSSVGFVILDSLVQRHD